MYNLCWLDFPSGSAVKNPLPMQEMWVQSLGQEDPLEKEMATHSSIPASKIPSTEEPGRLQSDMTQQLKNNNKPWVHDGWNSIRAGSESNYITEDWEQIRCECKYP